MLQLDLFEKDPIQLILQEFIKFKQSTESARRNLFARIDELEKKVEGKKNERKRSK